MVLVKKMNYFIMLTCTTLVYGGIGDASS